MNSYKIVDILNDNVLLAKQEGRLKILIKSGIGFEKKVGDPIAPTTIFEHAFSFKNAENEDHFSAMLSKTDKETAALCQEAIGYIHSELREPLDEQIFIRLTDHLSFALERIKEEDEIINPFLIETQIFYKKEYQTALKVAKMLEEKTSISIPEEEVGFIALHIHASRNRDNLSGTIQYAYLCNAIAQLIERELDIKLDKESLDYTRFVIHIKFTIERIIKNITMKNELLLTIRRKYKASYVAARKVGELMETELKCKIPANEIGFLAIHIEKLRNTKSF